MSVYGTNALSAYGMSPVTEARHRESDARAFFRNVYWIVWVYSQDRGLIWA